MSKITLSACLILGPFLGSSLAAAESPAPGDEPRETTEKATETAPSAEPEPAPDRASPALAAPPAAPAAVPGSAQPPSSSLHTVSHWYGWQTLTTDGASILMSVVALNSLSGSDSGTANALGLLSVGTFVAGGPIVHFAHGNVGKGLGSLALRVGLPILSGVVGSAVERTQCSGGDFCGVGGAFIGGLAGIAGTIVIDSTVLGYERVPERASSWPIVGVAADGERTLVTARGRF